MKLFSVGPVEMYESTRNVGSIALPYFRTREFSQYMLDLESKFKKIIGAGDDSYMSLITGSGTAAMEATVASCFNSLDKVLVISGGSFGQRFERLCSIYRLNYNALTLEFN